MKGHLEQIRLDSYKPLRELVFENIRQAIVKGIFAPGERLMEIQLADDLGVSRTPVREAIRKLELEGFVVMIPRRGTYVANLSIKDINDVYEIRISLDVLAAGLAAERIEPEELEELNRLLLEISEAAKTGPMEKIVKLDTAFHDVLYKASRNDRLRNIINNLREQITGIRGTSMRYPGRLADTLEEHRALVDSIAARDSERAQAAARIHLENAEHTLLKAMAEEQQGKPGHDGQ
jgi:DNA-binding GntR family transcriptional regulator